MADYGSAEGRTWEDERSCMTALAAQQLDSAFEVILVENEEFAADLPPDLLSIAPRTRVVFSPSTTSYALKNAGARTAAAPVTVILDADCRLQEGWLATLLKTMSDHPDVSVVSGRTSYEGDALTARLLGLVTRSYLDPGRTGETSFIANNAAGFRTTVLREHPLPESLGPFSARVQSESMMRAGHKLWFEPRLKVRAIAAGLALVYAPEAIVHHAHELGLSEFLRQHYQYGKGAAHFRSRRRVRRSSRVRLEPPAFYYEMLASPFKSGSAEPFVRSLLLLASQSALLAGAVTGAATLTLGNGRA